MQLKYLPYCVQRGLCLRKFSHTFPTFRLPLKDITYVLFKLHCQCLSLGRQACGRFFLPRVVVDDVNPLWTEETDSPELREDNKGQLGRVRDIFHPSVIPGRCFSQTNERKRAQIHVSVFCTAAKTFCASVTSAVLSCSL